MIMFRVTVKPHLVRNRKLWKKQSLGNVLVCRRISSGSRPAGAAHFARGGKANRLFSVRRIKAARPQWNHAPRLWIWSAAIKKNPKPQACTLGVMLLSAFTVLDPSQKFLLHRPKHFSLGHSLM